MEVEGTTLLIEDFECFVLTISNAMIWQSGSLI